MIAGIITAGLVLLAIIAFAIDAMHLIRDGERRCADARVDAENKAGRLAIAASDIATQKNRADAEKERADALDQELDTVASDGDAAGARERVLRRQARTQATDAAGGGDAGKVPGGGSHPAVARGPGDDLAKPGD